MKPIFTAALFVLFGLFTATAQETTGTTEDAKLIINANVNWAYRLGKLADGVSGPEKEYLKKLKSGISYDLSIYYKVHQNIAVGLKYNLYKSSADLGGGAYSDDITISYYAPSVLFDFQFPEAKSELTLETSLGYMQYQDKYYDGSHYKASRGTLGATTSFSYRYQAFKNFAVGPQIALLSGSLNKIDVESAGYKETIKLDDPESLLRIDLGIVAAYRF